MTLHRNDAFGVTLYKKLPPGLCAFARFAI
jgi:hypothetical protein